MIAAVLTVGEELGFATIEQRIARHTNHTVFIKVLPDGEPALVMQHPLDAREIQVIPQRSYGRTARPHRSISFPQRPDLTVEITRPTGETRLLLFDPKYKLRSEFIAAPIDDDDDPLFGEAGQPKKVDIDKMHAYRDAIRDEQLQPVVDLRSDPLPRHHRPLRRRSGRPLGATRRARIANGRNHDGAPSSTRRFGGSTLTWDFVRVLRRRSRCGQRGRDVNVSSCRRSLWRESPTPKNLDRQPYG